MVQFPMSLNRKVVLPFTQNKWFARGGFGDIYHIAIEPSHQVVDWPDMVRLAPVLDYCLELTSCRL